MPFHLFKFSNRYYLIEFPDAAYAEKVLQMTYWFSTKKNRKANLYRKTRSLKLLKEN